MSKAKKPVDWELAERLYRAGQLSVRQVAKQAGCSDTAVRKKAKEEGWTRDLTERVKEAVRTELVRGEFAPATRDGQVRTDAEIVQQAAANAVELVRQHRRDLDFGRRMVDKLMRQLEEAADSRDVLEESISTEMDPRIEVAEGASKQALIARKRAMLRAIELPAHAGVLRDLATAHKNYIPLERQAFSLDADDADKDDEKAPIFRMFLGGKPKIC